MRSGETLEQTHNSKAHPSEMRYSAVNEAAGSVRDLVTIQWQDKDEKRIPLSLQRRAPPRTSRRSSGPRSRLASCRGRAQAQERRRAERRRELEVGAPRLGYTQSTWSIEGWRWRIGTPRRCLVGCAASARGKRRSASTWPTSWNRTRSSGSRRGAQRRTSNNCRGRTDTWALSSLRRRLALRAQEACLLRFATNLSTELRGPLFRYMPEAAPLHLSVKVSFTTVHLDPVLPNGLCAALPRTCIVHLV